MNDWAEIASTGELAPGQIREVAAWLLEASVPAEAKASFLGALHQRGETPGEITALAE